MMEGREVWRDVYCKALVSFSYVPLMLKSAKDRAHLDVGRTGYFFSFLFFSLISVISILVLRSILSSCSMKLDRVS